MKLLRFLVIVFIIYFIRRFIQAYQALKVLQAQQEAELKRRNQEVQKASTETNSKVVEADFKVIR